MQTLNGLGYAIVANALPSRPDRPRRIRSPRHHPGASAGQAPPGQHRPDRPIRRGVGLGPAWPARPGRGRDQPRRRARPRPAFGPYRKALADRGAVDFDEQVYGAIEAAASATALPARSPGELPPSARRRVSGPHSGPRPTVPAAGGTRPRRIRGGRRRPGHLRPRWRRSGLSDRLRPLFPVAGDHPLEVNYRCPVAVVDAARRC